MSGISSLPLQAPSIAPELCEGWVIHRRLRPRPHAFSYRVFYLRVPLSQASEIANRWLSCDGFNLLSWIPEDYGPRDGSDLAAWVRKMLVRSGLPTFDGEVVLQTFPRVLGYVFNPISLWFVHDQAGALRAVICEVSNTFGERHNYLVAHPDARSIEAEDCLTARKLLHVSPFCEVKGHYRFRFSENHGRWTTAIDYHDGPDADDRLLMTAITGAPQPLTATAVRRVFARYPLFTLSVIARIHWQALRLWLKRVPWFAKPTPPDSETSF